MSTARFATPLFLGAATVLVACGDDHPAEPRISTPVVTSQAPDLSRCTVGGDFTTSFTHPYFFPATVGHQVVLEGEEGGEDVRLQITVLRFFQEMGVPSARIIEEREWADGALREVSWNYYAQSSDGSVCYFGEDVDIYTENGIVHDGAWCSESPKQPGIFLPAELAVGTRFQMETAPGIAMDEGRIVGSGPVTVPYGRFTQTLRVREYNPLDGDVGFKVFAKGVGLVVDDQLKLTAINTTSGDPQSWISVQNCGLR